METTTLSIVT